MEFSQVPTVLHNRVCFPEIEVDLRVGFCFLKKYISALIYSCFSMFQEENARLSIDSTHYSGPLSTVLYLATQDTFDSEG